VLRVDIVVVTDGVWRLSLEVLVVGLVALLIAAAFLFRLVAWLLGGIMAPFRPQVVIHTTAQTPADIVGGCLVRLVFLLLMAVIMAQRLGLI